MIPSAAGLCLWSIGHVVILFGQFLPGFDSSVLYVNVEYDDIRLRSGSYTDIAVRIHSDKPVFKLLDFGGCLLRPILNSRMLAGTLAFLFQVARAFPVDEDVVWKDTPS